MIHDSLEHENVEVVVIVPAAGAGKRLGGREPKQYISVGGETILGRTLRVLAAAPDVDALIVAVAAGEVERVGAMVDDLELPCCVVEGGANRFDSVYCGLGMVPAGAAVVVIHDAVRPFVTQREIRDTIKAARDAGAAIVATSPVETVKEVDGLHVSGTLDRNRIRLAQTPQAFQSDLFRKAYAAALEDGYVGTDEASLVERIGVKVVVVEADRRNRKITTPDDLKLAEYLASEGGDQ